MTNAVNREKLVLVTHNNCCWRGATQARAASARLQAHEFAAFLRALDNETPPPELRLPRRIKFGFA